MAKGSTIVIIVLLAIILVGGGIVAGLLISGNFPGGQQTPTQPTQSGGSGLFIDPNAGEYVAPTQAPQKPGVVLPGWGSITIPANTTEVPVDLFNPEKNEGYYYLTFELRLADGEVLYKSGLVKPGLHIQKITLSRGLPAGTYEAFVFMQPYYMDEAITPTKNNGQVKVTLVVK